MKITGKTYAKQLEDRHHRHRAKVAGMRWTAAQALAWIIRQTPLGLSEWTPEMGPEIEPAAIKLGRAIGADQIGAWGRMKRHGPVTRIPGEDFRISGLTLIVGSHGELATSPRYKFSTYEGTQWHAIEFDPNEIKREWPKPPPISATEWMLREAGQHAGGPIAKRDDMVHRCMSETNCTKREAEAAHKSLPEGLKRKRGKPPKNSG